MSKFQIVIDCETENGAFFFVDARGLTRDILRTVTASAEMSMDMVLEHVKRKERIIVTGSRIVNTNTEFEYTS